MKATAFSGRISVLALAVLVAMAVLLFPCGVGAASVVPPGQIDAWAQASRLTASAGAANDALGTSVAVSGDGSTIVAGAPRKQIGANVTQGATFVFVRPASGWANGAETARLTTSDGALNDQLGINVAVSVDGSVVVVGAPLKLVGANASQGAVYVFVRPASGWASSGTETARLTASDGAGSDVLGWSVSVSGDGATVVAGAYQKRVGGRDFQGAAYVFVMPASGWQTGTETARLTASDGLPNDFLGYSVAMSGDGSTVAAGAHDKQIGGNPAEGAVYVFVRGAAGWSTATETARLTASDGTAGGTVGSSTAISWDGSTVAAGAPNVEINSNIAQGKAYVFTRPSSGWANGTEAASLVASDGGNGDNLGTSVALSGNGSTLAAGAPFHQVGSNGRQGGAYVFVKTGSRWTRGSEAARLTASDGLTNDHLGTAVAVSGDAAVVVAGAPAKTVGANGGQGAAYAFVDPLSQNASFLPSSAHIPGLGGAYFTTDVTIANTGTVDASFVVTFLGNGAAGAAGPEQTFLLPAGHSATYADILASVFLQTSAYGAIRIWSGSPALVALGQTSTAAPGGGTFGQSVPVATASDLITHEAPRSIVGIREDPAFRTNLILANAKWLPLDVDVALLGADGSALGSSRFSLPPLGMVQVTQVVRALGVVAGVTGARVVLSTPTAGGTFAAYAAPIDNTTNDPRTLLPKGPVAAPAATNVWLLPSSAHGPGANGSFYSTDLTIGNAGASDAVFTLKFLGHDQDGTAGAEKTFVLGASRTVTYADVLSSVFGEALNYGAIRISSPSPSLVVLGQTWTPGFGGTFGQSVPAAAPEDLITSAAPRSVVAAREDAAFRTNLILANSTSTPVDVDVTLVGADGTNSGSKRYSVPPNGMTQIARVVRDLGVTTDVVGGRLLLSTPTPSGTFAAYASAVDNTTNDPRTLLPR